MPKLTVNIKGKKGRKKGNKSSPKQMTLLGQALRSLGGMGGATLGGMIGQPTIGATVGNSLGAAVSRWLGSGDYTVDTNSIVKSSLKASSSIPMMHADNQSILIRHREYLGEIKSNTTYNVLHSYSLNPGNSHTFPWLSTVASSFQEYKFRGLVFHFVPSSGAAVSGTSPSLGTVMMQTSYRATDIPPGNKVEMLNEYCATESVPSEPFAHPIECAPKENPFSVLYVRTGEVPSTDTKMMYDLGVTHVATSGQLAANNTLGDMWVTYEVELKKPIVTSNVTAPFKYGSLLVGSPTNGAAMFTGAQTLKGNLAITAAGNSFSFPKGSQGRWFIALHLRPTTNFGVCRVFPSPPTLTNCSLVNYSAGPYQYIGVDVDGTPTCYVALGIIAVDIPEPSNVATIALATPVLNGNLAATELIISPMGTFT